MAVAVGIVALGLGFRPDGGVGATGLSADLADPAVPETTVPETTVPETTLPDTTIPETTVPETTLPDTTIPETTVPETTVPETTVPETTVPETTVPETTVPDTTVTIATATPPALIPGAQPFLYREDVASTVTLIGAGEVTLTSSAYRHAPALRARLVMLEAGTVVIVAPCEYTRLPTTWTVAVDGVELSSATLHCE